MINYIEKGSALQKLIQSSGHWLAQVDGVWISDNDVAVQAIIDSYNPLADQKADAIAGIKATGLGKMRTLFPALGDIDTVNLMAELWLSLAPAARVPTANFTIIVNIYTTAKTAIANVNAAANKATIDSIVAGITWPI